MQKIELIQVFASGVGLSLSLVWFLDCFGNLRKMYRGGHNGVLEQLAWERLATAGVILFLQMIWFWVGCVHLYIHAITDEGRYFERVLTFRGMVGSVIMALLNVFIWWSWNRVRELDSERR